MEGRTGCGWWGGAGLAWALGLAGVVAGGEVPDYNRDIRPILSDNCFHCHGFDANTRKAGLRLDEREGAMEKGALVPGDVEASELVVRILSHDPGDVMPPPDSNRHLSDEQRSLLVAWVEAGGEYSQHWAFGPVERPGLPELGEEGARWVREPWDALVWQRLEREGLRPAAEDSRERWLRRASLDLTGLPPTVEEVRAFLADEGEGAKERVVERLLGSPHYGERLAVDWLDVARYAETFGYQADVEMHMWPWRDWVIRAFNDNLGYDDFIRQQLAGDLLPGATDEQVLATGFNRLHRQTNEGGSIDEEFRQAYVSDRVATAGTAFLGLTLDCARCHDHKYDPISQKDYFQLAAFFSQIDESGLYSHFTRATPTPTLWLWEGDQRERHEAAAAEVARLEGEWSALVAEVAAGAAAGGAWPGEGSLLGEARYELEPGEVREAGGNRVVDDGEVGRAIHFSGDDEWKLGDELPELARSSAFSVGLWLRPGEVAVGGAMPEREVVLHQSRAWSDSGSRGMELVLHDGRAFFGLIHFWPGNAAAVRTVAPLARGQWQHVVVSYDGSSRAAGMAIWVDGERAEVEVVRDGLTRDIRHRREWGDSDVGGLRLTMGARFRDTGFAGGAVSGLRLDERAWGELEIAELAGLGTAAELWAGAGVGARAEWLAGREVRGRELLVQLRAAREGLDAVAAEVREVMVMREMGDKRPVHLLERGEYDHPGELVEAATPAALPGMAEGLTRDRLGLAEWLVAREQPLTARVTVNRLWQIFFGRGLVGTPEDFGSQGEQPLQQDLLDWLAAEFMGGGWDVKAFCRSVVLSATYGQGGDVTAELRERDPENLLLARGPRRRLAAEQLRDQALAASGLLVRDVGGPSVRPYQPEGLWEEVGPKASYQPSQGAGLYRRSLYTFWRRTAPPPSMMALDAVGREVCVVSRETTATPLQALVLLNDPQFFEAARVMGEATWGSHGADFGSGLDDITLRLVGRLPKAGERERLGALWSEQRAWHLEHPDEAAAQLGVGERAAGNYATDQLAAVAAWTMVVQVVMNLDDAVRP